MVKKLLITFLAIRLFVFLAVYILTNFSTNISPGSFVMAFSKMWDSPHYIYLAQNGYTNIGDPSNFIVFMPFYSLVIKLFSSIVVNINLASLVASNFFFVLGTVMFYKLLRLDYSEKFSYFTVILLLIFPASYFYSATYPESLFLFLFSVSLYYTRKRNFYISYPAAFLLTLTRPFGAIIWPALLFEIPDIKKNLKKVLFLGITAFLAAGCYLLINNSVYGNYFAFQEILKNHWQKSFALPWNGIGGSWKIVFGGGIWDEYKIIVGLSEAITATLSWVVVGLSFLKKFKIRKSYSIFLALGVLLFTSTGFILSGPRYILSLPPFFIILAKLLDKKILKILWIIISTGLMIILCKRFVVGAWTF